MENKQPIPRKTKIAAWLMIVLPIPIDVVIGWLLLLGIAFSLEGGTSFEEILPQALSVVAISLLCSIVSIFCGIFLIKRKKWAWTASNIFLLILFIIYVWKEGVELLPLIVLVPLILLLIDRKNFFKIAS